MEWALIRSTAISGLIHLVMGIVTVVAGAILINLIDRFVFKKIDLEEEIARGNLAAAVLAGAMWLALAIIFTRG
jgi:uncharacterized membrane protein YjfL (UPF0719 family)